MRLPLCFKHKIIQPNLNEYSVCLECDHRVDCVNFEDNDKVDNMKILVKYDSGKTSVKFKRNKGGLCALEIPLGFHNIEYMEDFAEGLLELCEEPGLKMYICDGCEIRCKVKSKDNPTHRCLYMRFPKWVVET